MPPKPIARKQADPLDPTIGRPGDPPLSELISPISGQLAELKARQDKMFAELSPNAKTCFQSIVELDRYEALTDEEKGLIVKTKEELSFAVEKLKLAVQEADKADRLLVLPTASDDQTGEPIPAPQTPAQRQVVVSLRDISHSARKVIKLLKSLAEFEKEVAYLEPRVLDDGNLPDFEALKDPAKQAEVAKLDSAAAEVGASVPPEEIEPVEPGYGAGRRTIDEDDDLKPIKWSSWFEYGDTVVAPSKENAQAIVAMRIRRAVKPDQVNVWVEEKPEPMVDADGHPIEDRPT
jgi:hypothetical protein